MNRLKITPNETIFYEYDPERDELAIRLRAESEDLQQEPLAAFPHISLSRSAESGEILGVNVQSVQHLILQRLVHDIFFQVLPFLEEGQQEPRAETPAAAAESEPAVATAPVETADEPQAEAAAQREPESPVVEPQADAPEPEATPEPVAEVEAVAEPEAAVEPEAAMEPEAVAEPEEKPARKRRRRRKKSEESPEPAPEAVSAEVSEPAPVVAEPEAPEEAEAVAEEAEEAEEADKPARKRRRRKRKSKKTEEAPAEQEVAPQQAAPPQEAEKPRRQPKQEIPPAQDEDDEDDDEDGAPAPVHGRSAPIPGLGAPESFAFMGMHPHLGQVITAMGFEEPTPIQRRAVPEAMAGHDVIGLAQTGTGKTMAFLIPGLHKLIEGERKSRSPRMLVVTPTRELAVQVAEEAELLASHTDLRITTIYGGVSMRKQIQELRRGVDVIVATPGRLLDHMRRNNLRLNDVEILVLDEADRMLDMGFLPDIRSILNQLPRKRQTLLFSATMPPPIESLSMTFQHEPKLIEVARRAPPSTIDQAIYPVEKHLKTPLLLHLLERDKVMGSVLVFTETKQQADILTRKLQEAGVGVAVMHGDRDQREREEALQQLRDKSARVLVATDVAARGLDIADISHIVNYDMPQSVDDYVHRIGRTARGDAEGTAYSLVTFADEGMVMRIESALEMTLERRKAENFDYDVPTPSWAKPSAEEIAERLTEPKGLADRFKTMMRRRR